jgi:hypothetical protein
LLLELRPSSPASLLRVLLLLPLLDWLRRNSLALLLLLVVVVAEGAKLPVLRFN